MKESIENRNPFLNISIKNFVNQILEIFYTEWIYKIFIKGYIFRYIT